MKPWSFPWCWSRRLICNYTFLLRYIYSKTNKSLTKNEYDILLAASVDHVQPQQPTTVLYVISAKALNYIARNLCPAVCSFTYLENPFFALIHTYAGVLFSSKGSAESKLVQFGHVTCSIFTHCNTGLQCSIFIALQPEAGLTLIMWSHGEADVNKMKISVVQLAVVLAESKLVQFGHVTCSIFTHCNTGLQCSIFIALQPEAGLTLIMWSHGEADVNKMKISVVQLAVVIHLKLEKKEKQKVKQVCAETQSTQLSVLQQELEVSFHLREVSVNVSKLADISLKG